MYRTGLCKKEDRKQRVKNPSEAKGPPGPPKQEQKSI